MYASLHIYIYTHILRECVRVCASVCVCEPAPQMLLLCIFAYSLHTHSIKHAFGSAAHSFMPSFAFRQIFVFMNRFFVCLPPQFSPLFLFSFILRTNRHFLCAIFDSRATATSATNVLIRLEFQLHLFAPFRIHSNSSLIITVKRKAEGAWQLLYASFKVAKC